MYQPESLYNLCMNTLIMKTNKKICNDMMHGNHLICDLQEVAQRLNTRAQFMEEYTPFKKQTILIAGCVQSGKTNELLSFCWWSIFVSRRMTIFLTRNITADGIQLIDRIDYFNKHFIVNPSLFIEVVAPLSSKLGIHIAMANYSQVNRLNSVLENIPFNLCIDEFDSAIKSRNKKLFSFKLEKVFNELELKSFYQVGATATQFAVFAGRLDKIDKVLKLKSPKTYHGLKSLSVNYISVHPNFNSIDNAHLDINIPFVYSELMKRDKFVMLHTTTKIKEMQYLIANRIRNEFPEIIVLVVNGDGVTFYNKTKTATIKKIKINDALQKVKNYNRIAIVAGNIASRGVSFVSTDYDIHITDQYYIPGRKTHGESLLQGLRILGCYNDNCKLRLWCENNVWACINQQAISLNKMVDSTINKSNVAEAFIQIQTDSPVRKYSRQSVMKGIKYILDNKGQSTIQFTELIETNDDLIK
jgi:hypothetical protein